MNTRVVENQTKYLESLDYLSPYKAQIFDSWSGEPIGWGYRITRRIGDEKFGELDLFGGLECIYPDWYLIRKYLTRKEAIEKYGKVTDEEYGPRGGWRSVTFGKTKFISKHLKENI